MSTPLPHHELPLSLLHNGDMEILGRMPYSSNTTLLVRLTLDGQVGQAIYKPGRGERPLWDFPRGLYRREIAAYELALHMGLDLIPPTIERDADFGPGSLQWFIDAHFDEHYFTLYESRPELHHWFRAMAAFDAVANNTDRKSGHVLIDDDDHIWGIDNGLCFSEDPKLRTVIWEFGGDDLSPEISAAVQRVIDDIPSSLRALLTDDEISATQERAAQLLDRGSLPIDPTGHRYPWPLV